MIIKGKKSTSSFLPTAIILLCTIGGLFCLWYYLPHLSSWKQKGIIHCDAEVVRGKFFISHGNRFFNANTQNNEQAFEGDFSSKIEMGEGFQYGFGIDFNTFESGKTYVASVWRKKEFHQGKGSLIIIDKNGVINFETSTPIKEKNGWELLQKKFTIPFQKEIDQLRIYIRTDGKGVFYFDELKIIEQPTRSNDGKYAFQPETIELTISEKGMRKLNQKRKKAIQLGILQTDDNDWVNATLKTTIEKDPIPIELRLKGDWLDHLKKDKWSFRVKVKDPFAWKRLKTFSLQSPATRDFLDEWVLHEWWKKEDVLTPRYDFIELKLNGKSLGIYAYEEHFEKQLPEFNNRREGVIVRFSEEGFWADVKKRMGDLEGNPIAHINNTAHYSSSEVRPFKENQVINNPVLKQQLETAQNLLTSYLQKSLPPNEIFDTDKMAKYFAICDLSHAQHSIAWHNMRFYFNPVLNKLEPIGFDGFPTYDYPYLLMSEGALSQYFKENEEPISYFFADTIFLKKYISYLFEFSKQDYIENFLAEMEKGLGDRADFITKEFQNYILNKELIEKRISGIRSSIFPFNNLSLKAYSTNQNGNQNKLKLGNIHSLPIEIIGTGFQKENVDYPFKKSIILPAYITSPFYKDQSKKSKKEAPHLSDIIRYQVEYQDISIEYPSKYVFYKVLGFDEIFHSQILKWNAPFLATPPPQSFDKSTLLSNDWYTISDTKVIFKSGKYTVTEDIIIPRNYIVYFSENTTINFIKGSKFLSYSPIKMKGSRDNPITITSSDHTINGFTVLQTEAVSELEFVIFENLNTHRKENWNLTGGVTFYESDVNITDCSYIKNHCEDALNIIRSNFKIDRSIFSHTFSDGLDLDFSNGSINQSTFLNTTNDGLDISGSNVYLVDGKMKNCGDKGISVGEASQITILSGTIENSKIAIASKDLSKTIVENIHLKNCLQGFVAFQKKVEYGGGEFVVKNYTFENVEKLYNVQKGSSLSLEGKIIE